MFSMLKNIIDGFIENRVNKKYDGYMSKNINGSLKADLEKYFEAPLPQDKQRFLEMLPSLYKYGTNAQEMQDDINVWETPDDTDVMKAPGGGTGKGYMLIVQLSYISKRVWIASALIFGVMYAAGVFFHESVLWGIFSLMPFIVTISLSEGMRSFMYGMSELEMAARFSLKSVLMLRMIILGTVNMAMIFLVSFSTGQMWRNSIYMLVPYLLAAMGGLLILRKFPNRDGMYACGAFSVIICCINLTGVQSFGLIYGMRYFKCWVIAAVLLAALTVWEYAKMFQMAGEPV